MKRKRETEKDEPSNKEAKTTEGSSVKDKSSSKSKETETTEDLKVSERSKKLLQWVQSREDLFWENLSKIAEKDPERAESLVTYYVSGLSSIYGEAEVIGSKAKKEDIKFLKHEAMGSDSLYHQNKANGVDVRSEVKSVITPYKSDVDVYIMDAEAQHKNHLAEDSEETWHKTTVVKAPDNPWPYSYPADKERKSPDEILQTSEQVLNSLATGLTAPKKTLTITNKPKPKKQTGKRSTAEVEKEKERETKRLAAVESLKKAAPLQFKTADSPSEESEKPLPKKKAKKSTEKKEKPQSESYSELAIRLGADTSAKPLTAPDAKVVNRLMMVTERVTVTNVLDEKSVVLDKGKNGSFKAHWKGEEQEEKVRRHWNQEEVTVLKAPSDNRLHRAIKGNELKLVKQYLQDDLDGINAPNSNGDTPLHLAVQNGNPDIIRLLLANGADQNVLNNQKKAPIELASMENVTDLEQIFQEYNPDNKFT